MINTHFDFANKLGFKSSFGSHEQEKKPAFYTDVIDYKSLCDYIVKNKGKSSWEFNYKDFISTKKFYTPAYSTHSLGYETKVDTRLLVTTAQLTEKEVWLYGKLNKAKKNVELSRISNIENSVVINASAKKIELTKYFYYVGTNYNSKKDSDLAFTITAKNTEDYLLFSEYIGSYSTENIKEKFSAAFSAANGNNKQLDFLYREAPDYVLKERGDDLLWADLQSLLNWDSSSWFKDASSSLVKILQGFNNLELMYKTLENDPALVIRLYDYINGKNNYKFCIFLDVLSKVYASVERKNKKVRVPIGKEYIMDSDLFIKKNASTINIHVTTILNFSPWGKANYKKYKVFVNEPALHPLDIVELYDSKTRKSQLVPAIYVKYLSDQKEWAAVIKAATIAFDIISILISGGVLAAGARGLGMILAIADIGLASIDLLMQSEETKAFLKKTKAGEWFVEHWNEINIIGGMVFLSPQIINGIFKRAPEVISNLINQGVKAATDLAELFEKLLTSIKVELYLFAHKGLALCIVEPFTFVAKFIGNTIAKQMQKANLLLCKTEQGDIFALVYQGVRIAEGTEAEIKKILNKMFSKGKNIAKHLDNIFENTFIFGKKLDEHLEFGHISVKKFANGTNEVISDFERLATAIPFAKQKGYYFGGIKVGGFHILSKLNNNLVRIVEKIGTRALKTGETVKIAKIEYWVEEIGQWVGKRYHTFFPSKWDISKITQKIKEASENITKIKGNLYRGVTNDGIEIEFFVNKITREIETAFIII